MRRDVAAALLLVSGLLLPWNLRVGVGIAGTPGWTVGLLVIVTLAALASIGLQRLRAVAAKPPTDADRLRVALTIPYLLTVALFTGFTVLQSIRHAGSGLTAPGLGPGAWLGLAGALLAARVVPAPRWFRVIGIASITMAAAAVVFNLYWRTRFVVPNIAGSDTFRQNLVTLLAALAYGLVCLAPVILVGRWMISGSDRTRPALRLLGTATLLAGAVVWLLPVGRDLDAFHGIAQNTSTAGVGFEGYLAWVAAAALIAGASGAGGVIPGFSADWVRRCLALIALWCAGTAVLRVLDIASAAVLVLPSPPYNSAVIMAFDLAVALLAGWTLINGFRGALPALGRLLVLGALFVLTVARLVIGVALVPRVKPLNPADINAVYGNDLYQQITSTFDVTLCLVAFGLFVSAAAAFRRGSPDLAGESVIPMTVATRRVSDDRD